MGKYVATAPTGLPSNQIIPYAASQGSRTVIEIRTRQSIDGLANVRPAQQGDEACAPKRCRNSGIS
jgi:hypothetical protein